MNLQAPEFLITLLLASIAASVITWLISRSWTKSPSRALLTPCLIVLLIAPLTPLISKAVKSSNTPTPITKNTITTPRHINQPLPNTNPITTSQNQTLSNTQPTPTPIAPSRKTPSIQIETNEKTTKWLNIAALIWATGLIAHLLTLAYDLTASKFKARRLQPCTNETATKILAELTSETSQKTPDLLTDPQAASPYCIGISNPSIVLNDQTINHSTPQQLRMILGHELAHIQNADLKILCLQRAAKAIHWFNPFVHLFTKNLALSSEILADQHAKKLGKPSILASLILEMATSTNPATATPKLSSSIFTRNQYKTLQTRIQSIMKTTTNTKTSKLKLIAANTALAIAACSPLLFGVVQATAAEEKIEAADQKDVSTFFPGIDAIFRSADSDKVMPTHIMHGKFNYNRIVTSVGSTENASILIEPHTVEHLAKITKTSADGKVKKGVAANCMIKTPKSDVRYPAFVVKWDDQKNTEIYESKVNWNSTPEIILTIHTPKEITMITSGESKKK